MKLNLNILSIAGFDPSGGGGVLADIKTISALGGYGCAALTCNTVQNSTGVYQISGIDPGLLSHQISTIASDIQIDAIKVGALPSKEVIEVVARSLGDKKNIPIVLDPVISVSANGAVFLDDQALKVLIDKLVPLAKVVTPNLFDKEPKNLTEMTSAALEMHDRFYKMSDSVVYLKGGHLDGTTAPDIVSNGNVTKELIEKKVMDANFRGTGCTLSSAIATLAPRAKSLLVACEQAKKFVSGAITESSKFSGKKQNGPLNHFYL